jgi:tRNA-Thr(GGU) m(6)t(6)A37 methyltransferase TsaA
MAAFSKDAHISSHPEMVPNYAFCPIGVVRSPFTERAAAPRQPALARGVAATIELFPDKGYEHALEGLGAWEYVWVVFVFHKNVEEGRGSKGKVLPPRSAIKRGVFGTRSPHRPNPIGLSAVRIDRVDGCTVYGARARRRPARRNGAVNDDPSLDGSWSIHGLRVDAGGWREVEREAVRDDRVRQRGLAVPQAGPFVP